MSNQPTNQPITKVLCSDMHFEKEIVCGYFTTHFLMRKIEPRNGSQWPNVRELYIVCVFVVFFNFIFFSVRKTVSKGRIRRNFTNPLLHSICSVPAFHFGGIFFLLLIVLHIEWFRMFQSLFRIQIIFWANIFFHIAKIVDNFKCKYVVINGIFESMR